MDVREQLKRLVRIQELVGTVQAARARVDAGPVRIQEIEARFRERNAEYVATKERFDALDADRKERQQALAELEIARKKFMDSLMQVQNQREYAAVLKEIDTVKARISENEDEILKADEEIETLKVDLDARASHIEAERALVEQERSDVDRETAEALEAIEKCETERRELESSMPPSLVQSVRRVEEGRRGYFLAKAERETCTACHVRIRPQVFQEIRLGSKVHFCGNCKRFLYFDAGDATAVPAASAPSVATPAAPGPTEAMNGGAL